MPRKREQLLSGESVEIAYTDEELPPAHGEAFDDYLSEGGNHSTFIQARDQMHQMLNEMEPLSPGELL